MLPPIPNIPDKNPIITPTNIYAIDNLKVSLKTQNITYS